MSTHLPVAWHRSSSSLCGKYRLVTKAMRGKVNGTGKGWLLRYTFRKKDPWKGPWKSSWVARNRGIGSLVGKILLRVFYIEGTGHTGQIGS